MGLQILYHRNICCSCWCFFFKRKHLVDFAKIIKEARQSHADEIKVINDANATLIKKNAELHRLRNERLIQIHEEFRLKNLEIDAAKDRRIEKILKKFESAEDIANEIKKSTGVDVKIID